MAAPIELWLIPQSYVWLGMINTKTKDHKYGPRFVSKC